MEKDLIKTYYDGFESLETQLHKRLIAIKDEVLSAIDRANERLEMAEKQLEDLYSKLDTIRSLKKDIKNNKFNRYIPDVLIIYFLANTYSDYIKLNKEEIVRIVCMAIVSNVKFLNKDNKLLTNLAKENPNFEESAKSYIILNSQINEDGSFSLNADPDVVFTEFKNIFNVSSINFDEAHSFMEQYGILAPKKFIRLARNMVIKTKEENQKGLGTTLVVEDKPKSVDLEHNQKLKNQASKERQIAIHELANYYLDGTIISLPPSIEEFLELLSKCGYSPLKKENILNKMKNYINQKERECLYKKYLSDSSYEVYMTGLKNLDNETISFFIGEIDASIELAETIPEEKEEMCKYIDNCIDGLTNAIKAITKNINRNI